MDTKDIINFIGHTTGFDNDSGYIWGINLDGSNHPIGEVRGYASIQKMFSCGKGKVNFKDANAFQDRLGKFISDAINEKMDNERG